MRLPIIGADNRGSGPLQASARKGPAVVGRRTDAVSIACWAKGTAPFARPGPGKTELRCLCAGTLRPMAADDFGFLFLLTACEALLAPPRSATSRTPV